MAILDAARSDQRVDRLANRDAAAAQVAKIASRPDSDVLSGDVDDRKALQESKRSIEGAIRVKSLKHLGQHEVADRERSNAEPCVEAVALGCREAPEVV